MARYQFRAISDEGEAIEGEIEAADQASVVQQLRRRQQMPLIIQPAGTSMAPSDEQSGLLKFLNQPLWSHTRLNRRDAGVMTRELATLLDAGLTVDQALGFLIDVADSQPKRELFADLLEKVQGGSTLADAMSAHPSAFPIAYVSLIRAGEAGNALGDVFARLSDYLERAEELSQQVRSALVYPLMLMFMAGISIAILLTVVLPQFTPMFESAGTDLPWLTLVVVAVGDAAERYWWLALIGALFITLWFGSLLRDPSSRAVIDRRLLGLPLIGDLVAKIDTARLARTLGTLLANGVALPSALTIAKDTMSNAALRDALGTTIAAVKEGKGLSGPLGRSALLPPLAINLIAVGERSGSLESMLMKVADIFEQEVKHVVDKLMTLLVPVLTIGVGLVIALIIGSILSAILAAYQLPI